MKSHEAMSKCLGIKLSAELLEEFIKDLSCHADEADLLLYEAYAFCQDLKARFSPTEDIRIRAFLSKCEALGICNGDEPVVKELEQPSEQKE